MTDNEGMVTDMENDNPISTDSDLARENRTLKWKLRTVSKQNGKQGALIYELRNEVAALRAGLTVNPGDYQRLLRQKQEVDAENQRLQEKLATTEGAREGQ